MAIVQFTGFETGDAVDQTGSGGTFSIQTTVKRTGDYALRVNPTASSNSQVSIQQYAATGTFVVWVTTEYMTCYIRVASMPSGNSQTVFRVGSGADLLIEVRLDTAGTIKLHNGTTESASAATLSVDTWYRVNLKWVQNGTCELSIDAGSAQTLTGQNVAGTFLYCGTRTVTCTYDIYYDDLCVDDAALPGVGACFRMDPNGAGNYTLWTGTNADVDDIPHDSDATFISSIVSLQAETEALESAVSAGLVGTPISVKALIVNRCVTTGSVALRLRSGATDSDTTAAANTTTYAVRCKVFNTDPADAGTWTSSKLDAIEVGVTNQTGGVEESRVTMLCAMVWEDGVAVVSTQAPRSAHQYRMRRAA